MAPLGRAVSRTCGVAARTFSTSACARANKPGAGASEGSTSQPPTSGDAPRPADQRTPGRFQDSSAALSYKLSHHRARPPALPTIDPPRWSAEQAVTNILYNTPPPSTQPFTRHVLNCLVQNEPGVLSRVSGILAARGFNIDSLVVCATEIDDLSRMCIVLRGQDGVIEQARRQLEDLVPVWAVYEIAQPRIERELLLCKVSVLGPLYFESQLASLHDVGDARDVEHDMEDGSPAAYAAQLASEAAAASHPGATDSHNAPAALSPAEALREKHMHLAAIETLTRHFGGKIVDVSHDTATVEVSAKTSRIDAFLKLIRPYGILEAARTGAMAMSRSPIQSDYRGVSDEPAISTQEAIDAGLLPPG